MRSVNTIIVIIYIIHVVIIEMDVGMVIVIVAVTVTVFFEELEGGIIGVVSVVGGGDVIGNTIGGIMISISISGTISVSIWIVVKGDVVATCTTGESLRRVYNYIISIIVSVVIIIVYGVVFVYQGEIYTVCYRTVFLIMGDIGICRWVRR
jgi:hypothetical protein